MDSIHIRTGVHIQIRIKNNMYRDTDAQLVSKMLGFCSDQGLKYNF